MGWKEKVSTNLELQTSLLFILLKGFFQAVIHSPLESFEYTTSRVGMGEVDIILATDWILGYPLEMLEFGEML